MRGVSEFEPTGMISSTIEVSAEGAPPLELMDARFKRRIQILPRVIRVFWTVHGGQIEVIGPILRDDGIPSKANRIASWTWEGSGPLVRANTTLGDEPPLYAIKVVRDWQPEEAPCPSGLFHSPAD